MPLYKEHRWNEFQLAIWRIEQEECQTFNPDILSETDQKRLQGLKNPARKAEFIAARMAVQHLIESPPEIEYSDTGAPQLKNWIGLSLSHNREFAAAIVSKTHKVGIDLEAYRHRMQQLAPRYMSAQEIHAIGSNPPINSLAAYWSAKECMIKLLDAPKLDLRKEIRIAPIRMGSSAVGRALIRRNGENSLYPLYFKMDKDFCLCFSYA